jgi:hypothetical protein
MGIRGVVRPIVLHKIAIITVPVCVDINNQFTFVAEEVQNVRAIVNLKSGRILKPGIEWAFVPVNVESGADTNTHNLLT